MKINMTVFIILQVGYIHPSKIGEKMVRLKNKKAFFCKLSILFSLKLKKNDVSSCNGFQRVKITNQSTFEMLFDFFFFFFLGVSLLHSPVDFYYQPSKAVVFLLLTKVFGRCYLTFWVQDYEILLLILLLTIKSYGILL